jgi:predicted permease
MTALAKIRSITDKILHRSRMEEELEAELRSHIQHRADDLQRSGLNPAEAERRARIDFGGYQRYREESREAQGTLLFEILVQDARFAIRVLRKSPGFAVAAIVTLALAIGANAVVFGIMDGLILRPLNVPHAESLYGSEYGDGAGWQSYPNYVELRERNHSFADLAAFNFVFVGLDTGENSSAAAGFAASGNYFDVLNIQPYLGRVFHASDERGPKSAPYVVLTHAYWHSKFGDDKGVVGRVIRLNKHPFTVIGVTPQGFQGTILFISPDFFMPIVNQEQVADGFDLNTRGNDRGVFEVLGHLKPGVTPSMAIADMNSVGKEIARTYPGEAGHKSSVLSLQGLTSFRGPAQAFVAGLMLLAGLILLGACANLGSLFSAHAADRSREVALRLALGSSRQRILRQLLTEAVLISMVGGALGLVGSLYLLRQLSAWQPFSGAPLHIPVTPDAKLYVVALALALLSGLIFGIVPVRQVFRANPYEIIKAGAGARLGRRITMRDFLLVVQIAICGVLVTASLVAVRGLMRSLHSDFGFEPKDTMLVSTNLAMAGYGIDKVPAMQRRMIEAMAAIPGVERAGLVNNFPPLVDLAGTTVDTFRDGTTDLRPANVAFAPYKYDVSPGYFEASGTSLLAGRSFDWRDAEKAPAVAVVNREFANKMFGSVTNAVGRYFKLQDGTHVQVVGVAENGKYQTVTEKQQPAMFRPFVQSPMSQAYLVVRSRRDPHELAAAMRNKLHELDEELPVEAHSWNNLLGVVLFPSRVATIALGVLGMMGALLSITGIFGMAAYSVSRRLKELGIRIALGARRKEVLETALGRAVKMLAFGSAVGLLLGILASRVLASIVYQATPRDPWVLAGVVLAMALLGLLATWIPAKRALALDPLTLLREE